MGSALNQPFLMIEKLIRLPFQVDTHVRTAVFVKVDFTGFLYGKKIAFVRSKAFTAIFGNRIQTTEFYHFDCAVEKRWCAILAQEGYGLYTTHEFVCVPVIVGVAGSTSIETQIFLLTLYFQWIIVGFLEEGRELNVLPAV